MNHFLFSFLLLWQCIILYTDGFANNLVVTKIGCLTELDTSEVIMNNIVVAPEESDFPKMHLAVVVGDNHVESPYHYNTDELTIAFVNPYTKDEFEEEIQYVMQVEGPAEFIAGGAIGCEGNRRASARLFDSNEISLKINDKSASLRIWAGWATGQNAVRLTPNLILEPHKGEMKDTPELSDELKDTADEILTKTEPENPVLPDENNYPAAKGGNNDPSGKLDIIEAANKFKHKPKGSPLEELEKEIDEAGENEEVQDIGHMKEQKPRHKRHGDAKFKVKTAEAQRKKRDRIQPLDRMEKIDRLIEESASRKHKERSNADGDRVQTKQDRANKSFREHYESDEFANQFHMQSYIGACVFFVLAMAYTVFVPGRRRVKGRRDL